MTRRALTKSRTGALATGATATGAATAGAASLGALAMGAMALGAIAVGALAIGRLRVGRARLRRVEIGELTVGRLDVRAVVQAGSLTSVARVRAAPGKGDALERLLLEQLGTAEPGPSALSAQRSLDDPDLFLVHETFVDEDAFERRAKGSLFNAILRQAVRARVVAPAHGDPVELYRSV